MDPLQFEYPHYTPFQYAGNKPISYIDLDGLEEIHYNHIWNEEKNTYENGPSTRLHLFGTTMIVNIYKGGPLAPPGFNLYVSQPTKFGKILGYKQGAYFVKTSKRAIQEFKGFVKFKAIRSIKMKQSGKLVGPIKYHGQVRTKQFEGELKMYFDGRKPEWKANMDLQIEARGGLSFGDFLTLELYKQIGTNQKEGAQIKILEYFRIDNDGNTATIKFSAPIPIISTDENEVRVELGVERPSFDDVIKIDNYFEDSKRNSQTE